MTLYLALQLDFWTLIILQFCLDLCNRERQSFPWPLVNYNSYQVSPLAFEAKNIVKNAAKHLTFEEAFWEHLIFFTP